MMISLQNLIDAIAESIIIARELFNLGHNETELLDFPIAAHLCFPYEPVKVSYYDFECIRRYRRKKSLT